jgi:YD repeat-containing protein
MSSYASGAMATHSNRLRTRTAALLSALACLVAMLVAAPHASAAVTCPNANPVVNENNCKGAGTNAWWISDYSTDLGGFATKTSYNLGENVVLKVGRNAPTVPQMTAQVSVYRMGYYGGDGGRLVHTSSNFTINNDFNCLPMDANTGKVDCGNWQNTYTIPSSAFTASGIYLAKITAFNGQQTHVAFTIRDDASHSRLLYVLPMATYDAYNTWGGKSLYYGISGGDTIASGEGRAVEASFNRPLSTTGGEINWFYGPDQDLLMWLEKQGYDVTYTDDVATSQNPALLKNHNTDVISGHSEYWTLEYFNGIKAARDAGVNIASFSANTAYWKIRLEDGGRTVVCYKTVQGGGAGGSGSISDNDWGPDGIKGTADDALGADGVAGTADDHPENSTTTFRDNGAPNGDPGAPAGGRVGPDMPENQLFGNMYVGDNDAKNFPITIPAANANGEFSGDRIWRNTGIASNTTTNLGDHVGWEWDAVPTQSQYLSKQPANVKRVTLTNVQTANDNSWLQDEGRLRSNVPPPGQPGTVGAVKYTAPSGAQVFSSGTMRWSLGLTTDPDPRLEQATYNIFSDMGAQPDTPTGITLDPGGSNRAPVASFTLSANPVHSNTTVTFNASSSTDSDGTIVKYEWDFDNNGTFETNTGTNPVATRSFPAEGDYDIRLRITDNGGATDLAVRTLTVLDNQPPTARFTANPNPAVSGTNVTFNGSTSSDPDGSIVKYEWDFDGNGSYETNAGASASTTHAFTTAGTVTVGLRVTDNGGKTATTTLPVTIARGGVSNYGDEVLDTAGLIDYWRMGEASGTTLADSKGTNNATTFGGVTLGVPGGVAGDPNTAAHFDGSDDYGKVNLNLSTTPKLTVEFWLNWQFANDDRLAMEFTPNYHDNAGGFLIDPNAPQNGGTFAVGIGMGSSRNTAYFTRPANGWHHYTFVFDTTAPAAQQITPYVDGVAVPYTKLDSGTGAGNFANSTLYLMSRGGTILNGQGDMDELAIYNRTLSAATIDEHFASYGTNRRPVARFTNTPSTPKPGQTVTFDGSTSSDPDGSIVKYEWDLDGNGTYETNTGTTPTTTRTFAADGSYDVGLRVTDNQTGIDTETHTVIVVANQAPNASFTASPNPAILGQTTQFNASASADPDGSIVKYEWDLDGNGTYETDTGTTKTTSRTYAAVGTTSVGLRVTDDGGKTTTTTVPVTVNSGGVSNYGDAVLDTTGLVSYWRMGETAGPTLADSKNVSNALAAGGPQFAVPGAPANDPNTAVRFDGTDDSASANVNLSSTNKATVEFWLKWGNYANDDRLAMEFTSNFNDNAGGFLVDPNAPQNGGSFGVGIGSSGARNNVFFNRPSAGQWHHYAFVFDTSAAADQQITPYVDGVAVPYTKLDSSTGAGNFANSTLYLMSRAGQSLFGQGDLDEVALYNRALSAATVHGHFESSGTNRRPVARFTMSPTTARQGQTVTFNGSTSSDPDGSIVKYQWDLDGNGTYETDTGANPQTTKSYSSDGNVDVGLRVFDDANGTDTETHTLTIGNDPPTASFTATPNPVVIGNQASFDASASSDPDDSIVKYEWDLDGNGTYETDTGTTKTTTEAYTTAGDVTVKLRVTDEGGLTATDTKTVTVVPPQQPPTASFTASPNPANTGQTVTFDASASSDPDGSIAKYEWDLDGNGSYETDTGTTKTTTKSYASAGTVAVKLRVTDGDGMTATKTVNVYVNGTGTTYSAKVLATGGLEHYWRMGETTGTTLADSQGTSNATTANGAALGGAGAVDSNGSVGFDGVDDYGSATVDLSATSKVTVEFWLKWNAFANDDRLAMEFTSNFNDATGGFLVDPNAPGEDGRFGVAIGIGGSRNNAYFNRPTAGAWHHYALVLDSTAPAATQVVPYVDGQPVAFTKTASGTGAGAFANATLYLMSRAGGELFGAGSLDELAVYGRTLSASEIAAHFAATVNALPTAAFTSSPEPANPGQTVTFNGSGSADTDGTIAKYEWDLDGNGTYETDTGTTATTTKSYTTPGTVAAKLRVTDNRGGQATVTHNVTVNSPPTAAFTLAPSPAGTGQTVTFDATTSSDAGGSITKYEWDLDGNGSYETDTGTTKTATHAYTATGTVNVGLRVTDNNGATATTTRALSVQTPPTASFTVSPSPAAVNQTVTFNATASSTPSGTLTKFEWDLDGNGSYETDTGTTRTTTKAYTAAGTVTVGLRITDSRGLIATTTRSLTVNGPPTASFTVSPTTAQTRQTVTFNGSGSTTPSGTITRYEWDLDGNGTYETNTNATATTTKVYDTESTITVGLRVTASTGLTATTTRTLTVQSLYAQAVRTTAGLRAYWRLGETTGTTANDETTNNLDGVYENSPTLGITGLLTGDSNRAVDFTRSSSERVTVADNTLLDPTNISLEAWVRPDSSLSFGQVRTIFAKSNSSGSDFSYSLDYRRSGFSTNQLVFSITTTSNTDYTVTQTLNSGTRYHIVATYNGSTMRIYVNGVQVGSGQSKTGNMRNAAQPLRIGSFWTQDFWDGAIDEAAVYSTALSATEIQTHYTNGS